MKIERILDALKEQDYKTFNLDQLYDLLLRFDLTQLDVARIAPAIEDQKNYARNILMMDPMEVVILAWPPGVASAVHHHVGFWGVVAVLEGELDNISYRLEGDVLRESISERGLPGGLIREEDGVIHMLKNPSDKVAITAHFYCPALQDFDGMKIFDLEKGRIGVLNAKAQTASWEEPEEHFASIKEDGFSYIPLAEREDAPSHKVHPVIPKPEPEVIESLIADYYAEQAHNYDHFDTTHSSRSKYTKAVNELIAQDLAEKDKVTSVLSIACGTGRRAERIRKIASKNYELYGVDLSAEMCDIATSRGLTTYCNKWLDADLGDRSFDAITFLYAFGHVSSREDRVEGLKKIHDHLTPGGTVYLDVFNVADKNEWGPQAVKLYEKLNLKEMGYERGDVFYRKTGGQATAFLHYFSENEITSLLEEAGMEVRDIHHVGYTVKPGDILENRDEGALFVIADRPKE